MLLPAKARFAPGDSIVLDLDPRPDSTMVIVEHLGDEVARATVPADATTTEVPELPEGGYTVTRVDPSGIVIGPTAVEVPADPIARMRYGFVANFAPGRDISQVLALCRRLHLTAAQFYDWAYRHADLVGPQPVWSDPLGQPVSLDTVRTL